MTEILRFKPAETILIVDKENKELKPLFGDEIEEKNIRFTNLADVSGSQISHFKYYVSLRRANSL